MFNASNSMLRTIVKCFALVDSAYTTASIYRVSQNVTMAQVSAVYGAVVPDDTHVTDDKPTILAVMTKYADMARMLKPTEQDTIQYNAWKNKRETQKLIERFGTLAKKTEAELSEMTVTTLLHQSATAGASLSETVKVFLSPLYEKIRQEVAKDKPAMINTSAEATIAELQAKLAAMEALLAAKA